MANYHYVNVSCPRVVDPIDGERCGCEIEVACDVDGHYVPASMAGPEERPTCSPTMPTCCPDGHDDFTPDEIATLTRAIAREIERDECAAALRRSGW